jgi:hypothetical protein
MCNFMNTFMIGTINWTFSKSTINNSTPSHFPLHYQTFRNGVIFQDL